MLCIIDDIVNEFSNDWWIYTFRIMMLSEVSIRYGVPSERWMWCI